MAQTNTFPSSGSVGIGTISPSTLLHVRGNYNGGSDNLIPQMLFENANTSTSGYVGSIVRVRTGTGYTGGYPEIWIEANTLNGLGLTKLRTVSNTDMAFYTNDIEKMRLTSSGNVGIGTESPSFRLSVQGTIQGRGIGYFTQSTPINSLAIDASSTSLHKIFTNAAVDLAIGTNNSADQFYLKSNGNVGIGTVSVNDINYKLFVETGIRTRKIKVDQSTWSDYVFSSTYKLPTLKEVEEFVKQYKHLPDVPSAQEVEKNGIDLGDNQAILLKKIEELTLYIIDINKKVDKLSEENQELKKKLTASNQ